MKNSISFLLVFLLSTFLVNAQQSFYFDTYNTNDSKTEEHFHTQNLVKGVTYSLEIEGNYSIWYPHKWTAVVGNKNNNPIFPSKAGSKTGIVGLDPEYVYALPGNKYKGQTMPIATGRIEISLDKGKTWFHPKTSSSYNAQHIYKYTVVGQGFSIGVRHKSALNSDDYGMLLFTLQGNDDLITVSHSNTGIDDTEVDYDYSEHQGWTLDMPNVFTPNGDGVNDSFKPLKSENICSYNLIIYSRWGQKVYESGVKPQLNWDGRGRNSSICASGLYVWLLNFNDCNGNAHQTKGAVTILK